MNRPIANKGLSTLCRVAAFIGLASMVGMSHAWADDLPRLDMPSDLPTVSAAERFWLTEARGAPALPANRTPDVDPPLALQAEEAFLFASPTASRLPFGVGYDDGFVIASRQNSDLNEEGYVYRLRINGWGQLRDTVFDSKGNNRDLNQIQLKRARIVLSGYAFSQDLSYLVQIDGRSSSGDGLRILDYYMTYDLGHSNWQLDRGTLGFKAGLYKIPFTRARELSGKEFEFSDRSMASMYFDVNRSLSWGIYGRVDALPLPVHWEAALFNGFVTGGAETGSSGTLDNNNAFSARLHCFPTGEWGANGAADLTNHQTVATRCGMGVAFTTVDSLGMTEFSSLRVVDSGVQLSTLLPAAIDEYSVAQYAVDGSLKYHGLSLTTEVYFRNVSGFRGGSLPDLFDHGFWLQAGQFVVPGKLQLLARWSRVQGNSGTLGLEQQSSAEIAVGGVYYIRDQHVKFTMDLTHLDGATINSSSLDMSPGDMGWLYRGQLQFSF